MSLYNVKQLVPAQIRMERQVVAATSGTEAQRVRSGIIQFNSGSADVQMGTPEPGDMLYIINMGAGSATATLPSGVTWDGTNDVATFGGAGKALHVIAVSATRYLIITNVGTVAFS